MDNFLAQPEARRRMLYEEAGRMLGIEAPSVEKDLWVCWVLRELFALPDFGPNLTFKGGTSLSKGWKLIERFSEDIDVVIDREFLGFGGAKSPENAASKKQASRLLEELKAACQLHIRDSLAPALAARIGVALPQMAIRLENDADDLDCQTLLVHYPTAFGASGYIRPVIKIELGARSDTDPSATPEINSYLAEALSAELRESAFKVRTLAPERTFWEKTALLHEEGFRSQNDGPKTRLARHYYDIWRLIRAGVADNALANTGLFERVVAHRKVFFRRRGEAQESLRPGTLRILPVKDRMNAWKKDYDAMREAMFFGDVPDFSEILRVVGEFEKRFNKIAGS